MTRYKKYIKEKGFKLEHDYPMIPFDLGSQSILGVYVMLNNDIRILTEYNSLVSEAIIDRTGSIEYNIL